ncbi:hypothetical protein Landi51_09954 [Colletotrichum acutatum]
MEHAADLRLTDPCDLATLPQLAGLGLSWGLLFPAVNAVVPSLAAVRFFFFFLPRRETMGKNMHVVRDRGDQPRLVLTHIDEEENCKYRVSRIEYSNMFSSAHAPALPHKLAFHRVSSQDHGVRYLRRITAACLMLNQAASRKFSFEPSVDPRSAAKLFMRVNCATGRRPARTAAQLPTTTRLIKPGPFAPST